MNEGGRTGAAVYYTLIGLRILESPCNWLLIMINTAVDIRDSETAWGDKCQDAVTKVLHKALIFSAFGTLVLVLGLEAIGKFFRFA